MESKDAFGAGIPLGAAIPLTRFGGVNPLFLVWGIPREDEDDRGIG